MKYEEEEVRYEEDEEDGNHTRFIITYNKDTDEVDRYCNEVGFKRIAHMPDYDAIRRSRLKKKTLFEMPDEEDIVLARKEYIRLAETLFNGTEAMAPKPLEDREIFELLGFD